MVSVGRSKVAILKAMHGAQWWFLHFKYISSEHGVQCQSSVTRRMTGHKVWRWTCFFWGMEAWNIKTAAAWATINNIERHLCLALPKCHSKIRYCINLYYWCVFLRQVHEWSLRPNIDQPCAICWSHGQVKHHWVGHDMRRTSPRCHCQYMIYCPIKEDGLNPVKGIHV